MLPVAVALAILYPDDPDTRRARIVRVLVAVAALAGGALAVDITLASLIGLPPNFALGGVILIFLMALIPSSIAERIAGLARPVRGLGWALAAMTFGIVVQAAFLLLDRAADSPTWALISAGLVPGVAAGVAWHLMLPRSRPATSGEIARAFD